MSPQTVFWATAGLIVGGLHAAALWRAAHRPVSGAVGGFVRVAGVGGVLVLAALNQSILPAAMGWGLAYSSTGMLFLIRRSL